MLEPIKISEFGDMLEAYSMESKHNDKTELWNYIGTHGTCSGYVDIKDTSETHRAIVCRSCKLRVVIPIKLKTLGDLRKYMANKLQSLEKIK